MSKHVVIVGGGLSGLAAGVALAPRGIRVTILEQKPALGGRAYSFKDHVTGDTIDNGQHVLIAGYERTMHFLETIGTRGMLRVQRTPSLFFHHPQRSFQEFQLPLLPSPFNLLIGILQCRLFSLADKFRLIRAGLSLRSLSPSHEEHLASQTIEQWLKEVGQSNECVCSFWEPLAVSIMNERIEKASALVFVRALRKAFVGSSRNAALALPSVGLSQLYVDGAKHFITLYGGVIRCNADSEEVLVGASLATGVKLKGGDEIQADAIILAIPPHKLVQILPDQLKKTLSSIANLDSSPIVSIHLWFDEEFMGHEFVGLIGKRIQWLFNKRKINNERGKGVHVSGVISGAYGFVDKTKDELVQIAMDDIREVYRNLRGEPFHAVVVREKAATYSSNPECERLRPENETSIPNLFLAGDWTATGYPATIESAVMSAESASRCLLEYFE